MQLLIHALAPRNRLWNYDIVSNYILLGPLDLIPYACHNLEAGLDILGQ